MPENDALIQQMITEGINQEQFERSPQLFHSCPLCCQTISKQAKPVLLECGHILCSQCQQLKKNFCPVDRKSPMKVKLNPFTTFLNYIEKDNVMEDKRYSFYIKFIDNVSGLPLQNISINKTWRQLLFESKNARIFITQKQTKRQTNFRISIVGKGFLYETIKDKTIKDLGSGPKAVKYYDSTSNQIVIYSKYIGGS